MKVDEHLEKHIYNTFLNTLIEKKAPTYKMKENDNIILIKLI